MKRIYTAMLSILYFSTVSFSQTKWTRSKCIEYALEHSMAVKQKILDSEDAKLGMIQDNSSTYISLSINIPIFDSNRIMNRIQQIQITGFQCRDV